MHSLHALFQKSLEETNYTGSILCFEKAVLLLLLFSPSSHQSNRVMLITEKVNNQNTFAIKHGS